MNEALASSSLDDSEWRQCYPWTHTHTHCISTRLDEDVIVVESERERERDTFLCTGGGQRFILPVRVPIGPRRMPINNN